MLAIAIGFPLIMQGAVLDTTFSDIVASHDLDPAKQAACASDVNGMTVAFNESMQIVPASVSKLYLFDYALSKLPVTFRYNTPLFLDGSTLYINGGGDPQMLTEHLRTAMDEIHGDADAIITSIVIAPDFYFEWQTSPSAVRDAVATAVRSGGFPVSANVRVTTASDQYYGDAKRYQFESIPLPAFLKQTSNYSNNFFSDILFRQLGGADAFADYLMRTYGVGPETASFTTGSGLSGNYTTCSLTLQMLEHLDKALRAANLSLTDVMSVPVVDPGVMSTRGIDDVSSLVAKSGYIRSHRNLAGIINSEEGRVYFAVFTTYPPEKTAHEMLGLVDSFTNQILAQYRPALVSFGYEPDESRFQSYSVEKE